MPPGGRPGEVAKELELQIGLGCHVGQDADIAAAPGAPPGGRAGVAAEEPGAGVGDRVGQGADMAGGRAARRARR